MAQPTLQRFASKLPLGTVLNSATVAIGALIGLWLGHFLSTNLREIVFTSIGLVTLLLGIKMALQAKSILVVLIAAVFGGIIGVTIGINAGLESLVSRLMFESIGTSSFGDGLLAASIIFCVGPMTLLGCIQEATEGKRELLLIKSALDGIVATFYAVTMGWGVLASALVVLIVQSILTFAANPLKRALDDEAVLADTTATGGLIIVTIGLSILNIKKVDSADLLPALLLAPILVHGSRRLRILLTSGSNGNPSDV